MKLFTAEQLGRWDAATISKQGISAIDLMERAAAACVAWINENIDPAAAFLFFCGKGANGGDGLAMARMLLKARRDISVYILEDDKAGHDLFGDNLYLLQEQFAPIHFIIDRADIPPIPENVILIDALYGTGTNRPLKGNARELVTCINRSRATVISIDLPSGLQPDAHSNDECIVKADHTLTFQSLKTALLVADGAGHAGKITVLDIGLDRDFEKEEAAQRRVITEEMVRAFYKHRAPFSHKGHFGHALLAAGSYGKMGAALLAARAAAHSGVGLISCLIPRCGYQVLQTGLPESMVITDKEENFLSALPENLDPFSAIGIGPGIGMSLPTAHFIKEILKAASKPLVLDADALNLVAADMELYKSVPGGTVITPHPKEFDRLFGPHATAFERMEKAENMSVETGWIIILKGHHTQVSLPRGVTWFNMNGNAGMAKGGSGDALTGILLSLLAQGYLPEHAALLGVYLHGAAGDAAAKKMGMDAMLPSDLISFLPDAFRQVSQPLI